MSGEELKAMAGRVDVDEKIGRRAGQGSRREPVMMAGRVDVDGIGGDVEGKTGRVW
jgi:hypothetical protein